MRVFLGNLPFSLDELGLRDEIDGLGLKPDEIVFIKDRDTDRGRGFAFLEFRGDQEGRAAIELLNRSTIDGRALRANLAQEREQRSGSSGGPRGGGGGGGGRPVSDHSTSGRSFGGGGVGGGGGKNKKRGVRGGGRRRDVSENDFGWGKHR